MIQLFVNKKNPSFYINESPRPRSTVFHEDIQFTLKDTLYDNFESSLLAITMSVVTDALMNLTEMDTFEVFKKLPIKCSKNTNGRRLDEFLNKIE